MTRFRKPGLSERFSQLGYLLKHTATIVGRDRDILTPVMRIILFSVILVTLFFAMIFSYVVEANGTGTLLLLAWLGAAFYHFFYFNRQELALSWLVFETAAGRDRSFSEATDHAGKLGGQIRILAFLDMAAAWIAWRRGNSNNNGLLTNLVLGAMTEGWDLVNHFLLPAFAVDGVGFRDGMGKLRATRENVPETLVGVFGIDVIGRVVATIVAPLYILLILVGLIVGVWASGTMPAAFEAGRLGDVLPPAAFDYLPVSAASVFNWLPLFVCIFLGKFVSSVFKRVVTAVKVIYFTLFYARILHSEDLAPDIRDELESYLSFGGKDDDDAPGAVPT
ncbi:hypothetical protein M8756_16590 [Lutimaribacter sp. EGI FJ00015]|uniref:Uncharacterized protein n=1 Tax=Lutimaribacter degradans TaxID=2945989 RepID=A0ACC6A068_9RHOB|nr:hypothetical protein [Lutimaribacter sp. EGI FJ00013]MCM2563745.1 hypothetical protein [Lutimaribacter sp. EGI FJ00013]MCO0614930.1 hypothetical protein [Lutimaribacter sp. EGI FJ00015]MCO0637589.1 hypothetical protein [Lutimaribacter sp. EGI FJ00014]